MFFLSLFLLIPSILATVNYIDFRQDYLSSGYAKTYYLTFSLSNPLDTNHYMKLDFPISLHSTTAFSASWNQDVVAYTHDTNTVNSYLPATMTRSTLLAEASLNTYFIKFLDGSSNPTTLSANTPYMLRIVSSTAYTAGSTGPLDMVGVYITSGNQENNIILDSNPTFSPLYFSTATVGTLTAVSVTNPSINAAASVTSTVSFTVGTAISANARIILTLGSSQFQFLSTTCAATQTLTMATTNGCFLENAQKLIFKVPGGLTTGSKTVNVVVQAPLEGTVTSALTIYTVQDFYSEIVQTATLSPAYTAATLSTVISAYSATYAWGFPTDATLTRPTCLKLYYYSSTQIIYNTLTFRFTIGSMASLSSTSYKLRVNLAGASGVLENSIRDNLPVATGSTKVVCRAGSAEVTCTPLNSLTAGSTYFVSVRVALTSTTLSADFGKIELFAYDSTAKAYRTNSFVPANRATFTMGYQLNLDRQVSGKAPLTSWPPSTALDANKVGAKLGQVGIFEFNVNAQVSDFGGFSNLVTSGPTDGPGGFEIFTNYKVLVTNNPNYCSSSSAYASSNSICVSDRQAYMTTAPIYDTVRFRIGFYTASDYPWQYRNQAAFAGNIGFQVNYAAGSYPTISSAGYLADDDNLDLYFAAVNKQLNIGTTGNFVSSPNSCFMMNAYTVSNSGGALTNMNVYISNFWTGTGSNYMTGNELPTLIQVKGTLSNTDFDASSNKLSLFFTSLAPFPDEDYATSNRVACSGTQDVKCYYYPGGVSITGNYYMYPRIDIETTMSTTALQIVIPVSTTANVGTIAAVLGVSEIYSSLTSKINLGTLKNGKQFSFSFGPTLAEFYQVENTALNNENYYLATTNKKSGEVSTGTIYASHYDIGNSYGINTGSSQSALYTWTTKYNFYSQTTAAAPPTATFMGSEKCVLFTYYYPADTVYTRRYGVTCPVNSNLAMPLTPEPNINIPNFLFPTSEGVNMPESFGSLCTNLGVLTQFKRDIRTSALSPNYVTAATFDEVIYQSEKASIGTVEFTTTNILPQNSILKLTTTTVPLQFSLKEGYYCALFQTAVPDLQTTLLPQNCYQSAEEHALIFVVNNSIPWTDTKYFLKIYEINVTDFIEISFQYYNFTTFTANNFMIDDTVPTHTTVNPVNFLTQTRRSDLTIESYSVLSNTSLTKTQIVMTVSTSSIKPLTRFNEMRFQFWTAPENLDETFAFDVMDYGSQTTNILKSCRVDLPYIGCTPYYDMLTPQKFTIRLRSFRNPSTSVELKYYMWDLEGNFVLNSTSATPITYPSVFTAPSGFTEFFLEKRFNYITMYPEFIFNIKLSFTLTITSALVVRFPSAYSATDVTDPLLCVIDTLETNCFLSGPQEVTITDLPLDQPADQQFRVSILGLRQPKMTQPYNISVQITTKNQYASVLAYQEVPDIVPAATSTLGVVRASGVYTASSYSLESPDLTLDFTVLGTAGTLGTTRAIVLDFPNIYGLIYHNTSISYTLTGLTAAQTGTVSMQYFRIEIPVPGAGFQKNTAYRLLLKGIPNPFFQTYNHPLLLISITDVNRFGVEYQGQRYHLNVESPIGYTFNPNKHNLQFFQLSGTTSTPMTYLTPFNVFAGLPSLEFEIKVTTSIRFDRMIVMDPGTLNGVEFTSTPTVLNITSGLIGYKFSITFPLDAAPGFYGLKFANVETDPATDLPTTYYSAIPPLLIQLISQQNPIDLPVFVDNTLNLPSGGYSFPINFDLNRIKPPNSLTIVAYIPPTSDIEIQFLGFTEITLTSAEPVGSFTLVHTSGGVPGSSSTTISFYLDGPDKDLYTIDQTPITINLISLGTAAPTLVASVPSATITTNGFSITVTSDQISQVFYQLVGTYGTANNYWEISPKSAEEVDLAFVRQMVQIRQTYINDEFERKDEFYGVWNYQTASVATTFSFDGLRSGVTYKLRVWAVNLKNETSTMYTTDLTTLTNAGKKTTVSFTFNDVLENRQINKIACWLAVRYRLPYENVKDFLGYSCNDHRSRTDYPIDTILSSQYRIYQQRDVSTWQHTYTFYLYPLAFYALDDSYANINTEIGSALFATDLTTFITNWVFPTHPTLVSRSIADTTTSSVDFISSTFTVTSTNRSIAITDLELTGKGFIWVYALRKSAETSSFGELFVPTRGEFKYYLNRRLSDENYVAMRYYDTSAPVDVVFDGLNPSDDYILHWFAQNDDSGNENLTSYVRSQYIQTQSAQMMAISTLLISLLVFAGLFF